MRRKITPESYVERKHDILNRCLRLTEEILSSLEKWESLDRLFEERMGVIEELRNLEAAAGERITKVCAKGEAERLDEALRLILSLDKRIGKAIQSAQSDLLDSMRSNTQEQRFMAYSIRERPASGLLLNERQ
ncbi:MAG: hypothetical protein LBG71_05945 [Clostridiales Family XIII bacterium]|nr:hypothetical protein [Clostridiales Family XIII bacterium]